jgi:hypothetical protein
MAKIQDSLLTFIRIEPFSRHWADNNLTEDDLIALEWDLIANPTKGERLVGTGGFRKIRLAGEKSGKGKSGGCRVLYLYLQPYGTVYLVVLFGKSDKDNISKADRNELASMAASLESDTKGKRETWLKQNRRPRKS